MVLMLWNTRADNRIATCRPGVSTGRDQSKPWNRLPTDLTATDASASGHSTNCGTPGSLPAAYKKKVGQVLVCSRQDLDTLLSGTARWQLPRAVDDAPHLNDLARLINVVAMRSRVSGTCPGRPINGNRASPLIALRTTPTTWSAAPDGPA